MRIRQSVLLGEDFWVIMGAALVLYGVKDQTNDIDIGCSAKTFKKLLQKGYQLKATNSNKRKIELKDKISIYEEWKTDKINYIEDIPVADLYSIRTDKARLSREKDLYDIKLIDRYLNEENND